MSERRQGHSRLVYDKDRRTIVPVRTAATDETRERLARVLLVTLGDLDEKSAYAHLAAIEHSGDCTKHPWTCLRCYADEHLAAVDAILAEQAAIVREKTDG